MEDESRIIQQERAPLISTMSWVQGDGDFLQSFIDNRCRITYRTDDGQVIHATVEEYRDYVQQR